MTRPFRLALLPTAAALLLAACAGTPPYRPPTMPEAPGHAVAALPPTTAAAAGLPLGRAQRFVVEEAPGRWWQALRSPALDALVDEALRASPTLAAAEAVLTQARALQAAQAGSTQLPQLDLGLGGQRQQLSPAAQGLAGDTREFGLYSASVGLRWRFDVGGGIDASLRALGARAEVRRHELAAARQALAANLATAAITRARLAAQVEAQQAIARVQTEQIRLAGVRTRLGQATPDEASALEAQAELTRAGLPLLHKQLQQTEHLLAMLAGRTPAQGVPAFRLDDFTLPERLPLSVPSEWARQRPDIQAAEAAMRAAHAELGAAVARQYPQINLSASLGGQALTTSALFGAPAAVWSLLGQLSQPLFNAGLPAERQAAQAALEAAAAGYQRVVLDALRSVADALRAIEHDAEALAALSRSVAATTEQHRVLQRQVHAGAASPVQLLVADLQLLQARSNLIVAQAQRLADTVALGAALAGDPMRPGPSGVGSAAEGDRIVAAEGTREGRAVEAKGPETGYWRPREGANR